MTSPNEAKGKEGCTERVQQGTPRTDKAAFDVHEGATVTHRTKCSDGSYVDADFARQLERELAESQAEVLKRVDNTGALIREVAEQAPPTLAASIFASAKASPQSATPTSASSERAVAALHACEGLDAADLIGNKLGWLAEVVNAAADVEAALNSALRLRCAGNTDDTEPAECQAYEASEQAQPCPRGCCVCAEEKDVQSILSAIQLEEAAQPTRTDAGSSNTAPSANAERALFLEIRRSRWCPTVYAQKIDALIGAADKCAADKGQG